MTRISPRPVALTGDEWQYVLQPVVALPAVDLSISLKSRFLSRAWLARVNRWLQYKRVISACDIASVVLSPIVMINNGVLGQSFAFLAATCGMAAPLAGFLTLRYNIIALLMTTYDFWFFSSLNFVTFAIVGLQISDARIVLLMALWATVVPNIVVDASLRDVKTMATMNVTCLFGIVLFLFSLKFGFCKGIKSFVLFRYKTHELQAGEVAFNGLLSVVALLVRNVYRSRSTLRSSEDPKVIRCVSYRCSVRLTHSRLSMPSNAPTRSRRGAKHIQTLRWLAVESRIDVRHTLLPFPFSTNAPLSRIHRSLIVVTGAISIILFFVSSMLVSLHRDGVENVQTAMILCQIFALLCCMLFCGGTFLVCQRRLLRELATSFDFTFLAVQCALVHLSVADFFLWRSDCIFALTSWIWCMWVLCFDAITPVVRHILGLHVRFAVVVLLACMATFGILTYMLIFSPASERIFDRELLNSVIFGHTIEVRVIPIFYSSFATMLAWFVRLIYRRWTCEVNELVLIEGLVEYDNYIAQSKERVMSAVWDRSKRSKTIVVPLAQPASLGVPSGRC